MRRQGPSCGSNPQRAANDLIGSASPEIAGTTRLGAPSLQRWHPAAIAGTGLNVAAAATLFSTLSG